MTRASFRQADIERIIRAAKATGAVVQIDLRTLVVTIHPNSKEGRQIPSLLLRIIEAGPCVVRKSPIGSNLSGFNR